ncbi:MAG TPA: drug:proton antiporter, partial [Aurantimonas coralicida]|nr:drug:proton antiporter [Aurantimonas coralicida]
RMALLNRSYRREIEAVVKRIQKVETALEPAFQDHFVAAMAFPNKRDAYPELVKVQRLPNRDAEGRLVRRSGEAEGDAPRRRRGGRPPR